MNWTPEAAASAPRSPLCSCYGLRQRRRAGDVLGDRNGPLDRGLAGIGGDIVAGRQHAARLALVRTLALLVCVVSCASPATAPRDTPVAGEEPPPRFSVGGADAEEFGASAGYPKGDRATYWLIGSVVGSHSHLDEIFQGRLIHKAPVPSRLMRVAEPPITWT